MLDVPPYWVSIIDYDRVSLMQIKDACSPSPVTGHGNGGYIAWTPWYAAKVDPYKFTARKILMGHYVNGEYEQFKSYEGFKPWPAPNLKDLDEVGLIKKGLAVLTKKYGSPPSRVQYRVRYILDRNDRIQPAVELRAMSLNKWRESIRVMAVATKGSAEIVIPWGERYRR